MMMQNRRSGYRAVALWAAFVAIAAMVIPQAAQPAYAQQPVAPAAAGQPESTDEIVYIDGADGFIRVIDPVWGGGSPEVRWISPESNFNDIALGDFNNDGDMEIAAIRGSVGSGQLIIYDPVASGKTVPGQEINGIPWVELYRLNLISKPTLVAAGNFDPGVPGDEFLVGQEVSQDAGGDTTKKYLIDVYKATTATPDGREWTTHIANRYFEERWTRVATGDVVPGGGEEVSLVDEDGGKIEIYRTDDGWKRIFSVGDTKKRAQDSVFGDWDGKDADEVAWSRSVSNDPGVAPTLYIIDWANDEFEDDVAAAYDPGFRRLAFADVNDSGDDELYMLRTVPDGVDKPRLVSINNGGDGAHEWAERLDGNEWRAIVGGNVDGDARDELIIGRDSVIRVYTEPERGPDAKVDYNVSFNRRTLYTGNLDAKGFTAGPVFESDTQNLQATAPVGLTTQAILRLRNSTTAASVPYSIAAEGNPGWLTLNPSSGSVPANNAFAEIVLDFNAAGLSVGTYTTRLLITSTGPVENQPYIVNITFVVSPPLVSTVPAAIFFTEVCTGTAPVSETITVNVVGSPGTRYAAAIAASVNDAAVAGAQSSPDALVPSPVEWLTASTATNTVPDTITLTISRTTALTTTTNMTLLLVGDPALVPPPDNVRQVPIVVCPASLNYLPKVAR